MSVVRIIEAAIGSLLAGLFRAAGVKAASVFGFAALLLAAFAVRWWQTAAVWEQLALAFVVLFVSLRMVNVDTRVRVPRRATRHPARPLLDDRPHWLYRWWSADGTLLYVGISNDPTRRMGEHLDDPRKTWAREPGVVCEVEPEPYQGRAAVLAAEREAIDRECPRWNVHHNRGAAW